MHCLVTAPQNPASDGDDDLVSSAYPILLYIWYEMLRTTTRVWEPTIIFFGIFACRFQSKHALKYRMNIGWNYGKRLANPYQWLSCRPSLEILTKTWSNFINALQTLGVSHKYLYLACLNGDTWQVIVILAMKTYTHIQPAPVTRTSTKNSLCPLKLSHSIFPSDKWPKIRKRSPN